MPARSARTVAALVAATALMTAGAAVGPASAADAASAAKKPAPVVVSKDHGSTDFGFVAGTFVKNGTRYLTFDRAMLLTGEKAKAAKAAHGLDPDDGPDYYISNDNPKLRTYSLSSSVEVFGSQQLTGSPALRKVSLRAFLDLVQRRNGSAHPPFTLTFQAGKVVRITETYLA